MGSRIDLIRRCCRGSIFAIISFARRIERLGGDAPIPKIVSLDDKYADITRVPFFKNLAYAGPSTSSSRAKLPRKSRKIISQESQSIISGLEYLTMQTPRCTTIFCESFQAELTISLPSPC